MKYPYIYDKYKENLVGVDPKDLDSYIDNYFNERKRQVFYLHIVEGKSRYDIAKLVGITSETVRNYLIELRRSIISFSTNYEKVKALDVRFLNTPNKIRILLKRHGIHTLFDLTEYSVLDIRKWRGCGKYTIAEIRRLLAENGLALKNEEILKTLED